MDLHISSTFCAFSLFLLIGPFKIFKDTTIVSANTLSNNYELKGLLLNPL